MKAPIVALLLILLLSSDFLFAQGEIDNQETVFFNDEKTWAAIVGTNGWGIGYRYGRRINAFKKRLWAVDLVGIRHPKKLSLQNPWSPSSFFVYGKLNSIANLRFSIGQQTTLFRKRDKGGISVRWFYLGGGSVVWQKPIYYDTFNTETRIVSAQEFNIDSFPSTDYILGKASYFKGFGESSFIPGGYATTGLIFDFSKNKKRIMALEVGASLDVFMKPLDIMATEQNPMYVLQIYASIRFGKIVDRMKVRLKKTRKEMEKKRKKK